MKKTILTRLSATLMITFGLIACSKEKIPAPASPGNTFSLSTDKTTGFQDANSFGMVTGTIQNPSKSVSVSLINDQDSYGPLYLSMSSPNFKFAGVKAGIYKLSITAYGTTFSTGPTLTMEVEVKAGVVTDLGLIQL